MQLHHFADDQQRRRLDVSLLDSGGQGSQGPAKHPLLGRGPLFHQRHRHLGGHAMRAQVVADMAGAFEAHVKHHRLTRLHQRRPVQIQRAVLQMAGHEHARLSVIAMGQGNAGIGRATGGGGHPRHHLEGNSGRHQRLDFLAAAPEDERIAALEPQHSPASQGQIHQQLIDVLLRQGVMVRFLADEDPFDPRFQQLQNRRSDQSVVHRDVGLLHQPQRLERQQLGIAGAGAHQIHFADRGPG